MCTDSAIRPGLMDYNHRHFSGILTAFIILCLSTSEQKGSKKTG
jgi:hypothetical protein